MTKEFFSRSAWPDTRDPIAGQPGDRLHRLSRAWNFLIPVCRAKQSGSGLTFALTIPLGLL